MLPISKAAVALCVIGLTSGAVAEDRFQGQGPIYYPNGPIYGVYDPARDFRNDAYVGIESFYFPWEGSDLGWLRDVDEYSSARGRTVLLTVEPFSWEATTQQRPQSCAGISSPGATTPGSRRSAGPSMPCARRCGCAGGMRWKAGTAVIRGRAGRRRTTSLPTVTSSRVPHVGAASAKYVWSPRARQTL